MKKGSPSFAEVEAFVRSFGAIPETQFIAPDTCIEEDLGITGDDGDELLRDAAKHFNVILLEQNTGYRDTFGLGPNEFLFHSEGVDFLGISTLIGWARSIPKPVVVDLTVGELHEAICRRRDTGHAI